MSQNDLETIRVAGARVHNLRGVSLDLPKNRLICFTGVSGSGKSSLAFDTLYAEGQRRYIESLSSYARQFMGELPKPDVDQITGLAPSISIQQKATGWNPRSTVGTITQIHDYLRVLFARAGTQYCTSCGRAISAQTRDQMLARVMALPEGTRFLVLASKARGQKGEHRDLFDELQQQGFARARVDGQIIELSNPPELDRYRRHDVDVVIDRLVIRTAARARIAEAIDQALGAGGGSAIISVLDGAGGALTGSPAGVTNGDESPDGGGLTEAAAGDPQESKRSVRGRRGAKAARMQRAVTPAAGGGRSTAGAHDILLSAGFACATCGLSFEPPNPQMFSFNSPQGMCSACDGLGTKFDFDPDLLIPDKSLSLIDGCIVAFRKKLGTWRTHLYAGAARYLGVDLKTPWTKLPAAARQALLFGTGDAHITYEWRGMRYGGPFAGALAELRERYRASSAQVVRSYYEQFMRQAPCSACGGARLNPQALAVRIRGKLPPHESDPAAQPDRGEMVELSIDRFCQLPISRALAFLNGIELDGVRKIIAEEPLKEMRARLGFLVDVGLDYLTLDRAAPTLSGGESQRIRLASQIGCGLVGVLYVLDEPSIGLHPRDNERLLRSLERLRDIGNTVVVVEHDRDTMERADFLVDFGPGPGTRGGHVVASGGVSDLAACEQSLTGAYLSGRAEIAIPATRRAVRRPGSAAAGTGGGAKPPRRNRKS